MYLFQKNIYKKISSVGVSITSATFNAEEISIYYTYSDSISNSESLFST